MKRLAIFGGAFDPPHKGHKLIIDSVMQRLKLDHCYVVPTFSAPHKKNTIASYEDRIKMAKLAFEDGCFISVERVEDKLQPPSFSVHTLNYFNQLFSEAKLYFIIGYDSYLGFKTWYKWEEILEFACLVVVCRPGYSDISDLILERSAIKSSGIIFINLDSLDISSSQLRESISDSNRINKFLDHKVAAYIKTGLYGYK